MNPTTTRLFSFAAALLLIIGSTQAKSINGLEGQGTTINTAGLTVAPSGFEENKGQVLTTAGEAAPFVRYRLTQGNTNIFLLGNGIAYQFNQRHYPEGYKELEKDAHLDPAKQQELDALRKEIRLETYRMDMLLEGANPNARITTEGRSDDYTQYYDHDALNVHTYSKVTYHDVYPGIDWVIYTTEGASPGAPSGVKYDFVLRPGADPALIQLRFKDHEELFVDADGQLIHGNRMGRFTEERPVSFQNGKEVHTRFVLKGDRLGFLLGAYDPSQPLIIDPARIWGTYYGGTEDDRGNSCAVDASGNVYLAGTTNSTTAIASGGHDNTIGGGVDDYDAFLVKLNASGVRQWATYYGGTGYGQGNSCAVDVSGNVFLAGRTNSNTAIASGGHQNTYGGVGDAFLVKFDASGVRQWATYYGGTGDDYGRSCTVDASGSAYLAGITTSTTAIGSGGHQNMIGSVARYDAFLVKFNASGVRQWATYCGGADDDYGNSCAVDASGNVYLVGNSTSSTSIASGGHQNTYGGGTFVFGDAFLVKFDTSGLRQWGTYYGGTGADAGSSCAVDGSGNVYLAGFTTSTTSIGSGGHQNTYGGGTNDAFLVKFDTSGLRQWGTHYGGTGADAGSFCAVDASGNVYLAGETNTNSTTAIGFGGHQNTYGGGDYDAFLVKFNAIGVRQWATYYGGTGNDFGRSCSVDGSGNVYLAGITYSTTAIASGGHQNTFGGNIDALLVKFESGTGTGFISMEDRDPSFSIWPNPNAGDHFFLQPQQSGLAVVQLFDALGKLQRTEQLQLSASQAPVEVALGSHLAKGLYMVRITVAGRSSVAPLMIE